MEIFSAGTSGSTAEEFFRRVSVADITTVVDTRLHNNSQLAGYSKGSDLRYFLDVLTEANYLHETLLAPEQDALKAYRVKAMSWHEYETRYLDLLRVRRVADRLDPEDWGDRALLLCSEPTPEKCHRRLAADYLATNWGPEVVASVRHL